MRWINPKAFVQKRIMILLAVCLLTIVPALAQTGGGYDLGWSTIDGGGGGILIYDFTIDSAQRQRICDIDYF